MRRLSAIAFLYSMLLTSLSPFNIGGRPPIVPDLLLSPENIEKSGYKKF